MSVRDWTWPFQSGGHQASGQPDQAEGMIVATGPLRVSGLGHLDAVRVAGDDQLIGADARRRI